MKHSAYYLVNDKPYFNAFDAWSNTPRGERPLLELASGFQQYDWTIEPKQSIQVLEDEYVKRLAGKDKDLRVMYSGGTDSHTIAHAFARNGISVKYSFVEFQSLGDHIIESSPWTRRRVDRLKKLHRQFGLPDPEYEVIEVGQSAITDHFTPGFYKEGAYWNCNRSFNVNQFFALLKYSKWPAEKTVTIFGMEKPRLFEDEQGVFWQLSDAMSMYGHSNEHETVWFYCSNEALDLVAKQAWAVLNHVKHKWRTRPIGQALTYLQTDDRAYYEWCTVLGRYTDLIWANLSKQTKTKQSSYDLPDDSRYTHLSFYQAGEQAWKNYTELFNILKELTGSSQIESVFTRKHYLVHYP